MSKRVIYFTAGAQATTAEQAEINRLKALAASAYDIQVRNAALEGDFIETCDLVAGTIPTDYSAKTKFGTDGKIDAARPLALKAFPATLAISSGTAQLYVVKAAGSNADDVALSDVTASAAGTTYSSSATSKATVSAEGVVTKVAAGTTIITVTHTYATGKTLTSTVEVTVS